MQSDGFALQHVYKDAVILDGQKKKKRVRKKPWNVLLDKSIWQVFDRFTYGELSIFLVKSAKLENLSIFLHQTQGQMQVETMQ